MASKSRLRYLTKSRFKIGRQCPVKLYYYGKKEYPSKMDDNEFMAALAEGGFQVGELAKCYYPGGHDIKSLEYETSLNETNHLLQKEDVIIYEAAIQYDNYFIRVDILKKVGNKLHLIEVKAKSINSEEESFLDKKGNLTNGMLPYLEDIAFQTFVAQKAFPNYDINSYLMLADKTKVASVDGLNQKFRIVKDIKGKISVNRVGDVSLGALGNKILVELPVDEYCNILLNDGDFINDIYEFSKHYKEDIRYPITIKNECKGCEYKYPNIKLEENQKSGFEECWKSALGWKNEDFEKPHVFDLWNFRSKKYIEGGIYFMDELDIDSIFTKREIEPDHFNTQDRQYFQVLKSCYEKDGQEIIHPELNTVMKNWRFPLHFIDFETTAVAIPFYKGQRPYESIAFQFSCHTLYENGRIVHDEWINKETGKFPNFEFVKALKAVLDKDDGSIFRFAAHENTILRHIHEQLKNEIIFQQYRPIENPEELREWIDTITQFDSITGSRNMIDLCDMVKKYYYHPATNGSNSIKAVLAAIISTSECLKKKYSEPYNSQNFHNMIWWQLKEETGKPYDPYKLLPSIDADTVVFNRNEIRAGGAAMDAYNAMQYMDMTEEERQVIIKSLLKYCELDTLAMVMIYEHWNIK